MKKLINILNNVGYNVVLIFHPHSSNLNEYFITSKFTAAENLVVRHSVEGKIITPDLVNKVESSSDQNIVSQGIISWIEQTKEVKRAYSKDFSYIQYLSYI